MLLNQTGKMNTNIYSLTELIDIAKQGTRAPPPVGDEGIEVQPDQDQKDDKVNQLNPPGEVLIRPGQDVKDNTPQLTRKEKDNIFSELNKFN